MGEKIEKINVLMLADHIASPSGVGTQTRYIAEALLNSGKFSIVQLGGAVKHLDYTPQKSEQYGDDLIVYPVDGYGTADIVRSVLRNHNIDIVWIMTDPRFWGWLWFIEHEIRPLCPIVYYHVWDNLPIPKYNGPLYRSNDRIITISKITQQCVSGAAPEVSSEYLPHAVNTDIFTRHCQEEIDKFLAIAPLHPREKFVFFWNNRNARRKQTGSLLMCFKKFLDIVGHDNAALIMHTDPKDINGQDINVIIQDFELNRGQVLISLVKIPPHELSMIYNLCDCTINISDAEGFGLATLESLACETPIIVNMTGGLQEQVTDGEKWFGIGVEPVSKPLIGSQEVPYIFEDHVSDDDVVNAMLKMYHMSKEERAELGKMGRKHVLKNYNFENYCERWVQIMEEVYDNFGSWDDRTGYKRWHLREIVS